MLYVATTLFLWQTSRRTGGNSVSEPSRGVASAKVGASQDSRTKAGMPQSFAFAEALTVLTLKRMAIASDVSLVAERKSERLLELDSGAGHTDRTEADNATVVADQERRYDLAQMSASRRAAERETLWGK